MANRRSLQHNTTPVSSKSGTPSANLLRQCNKCECLLSPKDLNRHTDNVCSSIRCTPFLPDVGHGYIRQHFLFAEVVDVRDKDVNDLPDERRDVTLFMNGVGMDYMRLESGDAVRVQSSDGRRIWSCVSVLNNSLKNPCHIAFSDRSIHTEEGDIFLVEKMPQSEAAKVVFVESVTKKSNTVSIEVLIQVRSRVMDWHVFHGMIVKLDDGEEEFSLSMKPEDIADNLSLLSVTTNGHSDLSPVWPDFYRVTEKTRFSLPMQRRVLFEDIAGLDNEIGLMRKHLLTPIQKNHLTHGSKFQVAKSILIHGFTGTGKTLAVDAFISEYSDRINCVKIDAASLLSKSTDSTEKKMSSVFEFVLQQEPSILFLDRMDVLLSGKKLQTDQDKRLMACLLMHFDRVSAAGSVFFVGITNQIDGLDSSLRGPDKFQLEIEFPIPIAKARKAILRKLLSVGPHDVPDDVVDSLAEKAFSFTGADLKAVVSSAFSDAIQCDRASITQSDLMKAFQCVKPSAMKEILLEVPSVKWAEIGGVSAIRAKLEQMVIWPFKFPEYFDAMGICPRKGILMYGPPGCSKTMIGKALATESNLNFISIKGPELFNKYVGESERAVRQIFRKAKQASPSILFFDEIDALAPERSSSSQASSNNSVSDRVLAQLLTEMDGIEALSQVVIVAATNRPDKIDPALLRPGRLDSLIYVPLPDASARTEIFHIRTKNMPLQEDIDVAELVQRTAGYSGAEVTAICTEAGLTAMAEFLNCESGDTRVKSVEEMKVRTNHFLKAASSIKARTSTELIHAFQKYQQSN